jgi:predicted ATPase
MGLSRLVLSNFRSFNKVDIDLSDLNIIIGANASGKSNFIQVFKFLRDLSEFGLDNAISMQGGSEYLLNSQLGSSQEFSMDIYSETLEKYHPRPYSSTKKEVGYDVVETIYSFSLDFSTKRKRFEILRDILRQKCKFYSFKKAGKGTEISEYRGDGEIVVDSSKNIPKLTIQLPPGLQEKDLLEDVLELRFASTFLKHIKLKSKQLYLESSEAPPYFPSIGTTLRNLLAKTSIYDFDPRLSKRAQLITGRAELEPDGSNLAVVINNLLKNKERSQKFYNLLGDLLPFVDRFRVQNIADTVLFTLREKYTRGRSFPAFLLSDGTINLTSLIICLFFENKTLKIIEEPERNIHPHLISRVMNLMKEASKETQIVTTTHNPEVVRHSSINDLLLVFRTKEGFSEIERPADKERVKAFLQEEMGIEELYVQNLL